MAKFKPLSEAMQQCLDFLYLSKKELTRYPGGRWALAGWGPTFDAAQDVYYSTGTIRGLLARGLLVVTNWGRFQGDKYPTAVYLSAEGLKIASNGAPVGVGEEVPNAI